MPDNHSMPAKILFFGDTVGKPGRLVLLKAVPELREKYDPDFVIVNVENIAHGKGVTANALNELASLDIDVYTSGNHAFDKAEFSKRAFEITPNLIRPANYIGDFPGKGFVRAEKNGHNLLVMNLNATVFFEKQFPGQISSPFQAFDEIFSAQKKAGEIVFVDFHSEATSEKRAFGFYADGRASMVCGTHTHVATADWQILPKGEAFVSDAGMCGALNSVLGVPIQNSLEIFLGGKFSFEVEESNPIMVNALYAEIGADGRALKVEKIYKEYIL